MKKQAIALMAALAWAGAADATILTFDDLPVPNPLGAATSFIPAGYGGFEWVQMGYMDQATYDAYFGSSVTEPSSPNVAFNDNHPINGYLGIRWLGEDAIDFLGAEFSSWSPWNVQTYSMQIHGYNDGVYVGSATVYMGVDQFAWQSVNLYGVDELQFDPDNWIGHLSYDNFTFEQGGTQVPDPGSTAPMLALVLLSLRLLRRRP